MLGVVGAALDFISGIELMGGFAGMSMINEVQFLSGTGLVALGAVVLAVGLVIVLPQFAHRMGLLGALMEVCGILMGLASSYAPSMNSLVADVMLVVAILMFLNGALMQSRRKNRKV